MTRITTSKFLGNYLKNKFPIRLTKSFQTSKRKKIFSVPLAVLNLLLQHKSKVEKDSKSKNSHALATDLRNRWRPSFGANTVLFPHVPPPCTEQRMAVGQDGTRKHHQHWKPAPSAFPCAVIISLVELIAAGGTHALSQVETACPCGYGRWRLSGLRECIPALDVATPSMGSLIPLSLMKWRDLMTKQGSNSLGIYPRFPSDI